MNTVQDDMTIDDAHAILDELYQKAQADPRVLFPLAWAVYGTWKVVDRNTPCIDLAAIKAKGKSK